MISENVLNATKPPNWRNPAAFELLWSHQILGRTKEGH